MLTPNPRQLLQVAVLAIASAAGCASEQLPAARQPQPLQATLDLSHFVRAERLSVNTDQHQHFYAELSQEEGVLQLRELARVSPVEESFVLVHAGRHSVWFEIGEREGLFRSDPANGIEMVLEELRHARFPSPQISLYHLHTQAVFEEISLHAPLIDVNLHARHGMRVSYPPELQLIPSPSDLVMHVKLEETIRHYATTKPGATMAGDYVVTPNGIFSVGVQPDLHDYTLLQASISGGFGYTVPSMTRTFALALLRAGSDSMQRAQTIGTPASVDLRLDDVLHYCQELGIIIRYQPFH